MKKYLFNIAVDGDEIDYTREIIENYYQHLFDKCYYINSGSIEEKKAVFIDSLKEIKKINGEEHLVLHFIGHGVIHDGKSCGIGFLGWGELSEYLIFIQNSSAKIILNLMGVCYSSGFSSYSGYDILWAANTETNDIDSPMKIYLIANYDFYKYCEILKGMNTNPSTYNCYINF